MDVLFFRQRGRIALLLLMCILATGLSAAEFATTNFVVTADSAELAREVAQTAEKSRQKLARLWLGVELPAWSSPCPIQVKSGEKLGAGGETSFTFKDNEVFGWSMKIQGTRERILDSVVPHEVSHMILASYFRTPVPRWIDEGAATSIEADVERDNYRQMLIGFLNSNKGIPFNKMVHCTDYPSDIMPFYAQGFSVCEYLIAIGGHRRFIEFAKDGIKSGDWSDALHRNYTFADINDFQIQWTEWISTWYHQGMPENLPLVAKMSDYPYDINGRPIDGAVLTASALPHPESFAGGVGSARPQGTLVPLTPRNQTAALAYQGSYGRGQSGNSPYAAGDQNRTAEGVAAAGNQPGSQTAPVGNNQRIAPPMPSMSSSAIMLGQEKLR